MTISAKLIGFDKIMKICEKGQGQTDRSATTGSARPLEISKNGNFWTLDYPADYLLKFSQNSIRSEVFDLYFSIHYYCAFVIKYESGSQSS